MTGDDGMFDPLPKGTGAVKPIALSPWRPVMPVPGGAPPPPAVHPKLGTPAKAWRYLDAAGRLNGVVWRFDLEGGAKEIRSLAYAEHPKFGRQWRWLGFPRPRPLYGLDRLAARPAAPVVICEGEKAADAAGELLPDHVAITSPGGSKAATASDWSALAGRVVVIWRDADTAGLSYAHAVLGQLGQLSPPPKMAIVTPPEGVAEGWDAADAAAEGWTPERTANLIAAAAAAAPGNASSTGAKRSARDGLLALLDDAELWHDSERVAYATVPKGEHRENYKIKSDAFRNWLTWRSYEEAGFSPGGQSIDDACRTAEALALNRGPCCSTYRRVGEHAGKIYLDLGCPRWRAVEIDIHGRRVIDGAPIKFLRSRGMEALPEPEAGELIEALREFVNVESEADFRLLLAWLAAALRPVGPFPILTLIGEQGASKSTLARICRLLTDPNAAPIRSLPADERDLLVSADNSWIMVFDNVSTVPAWLSDAFCRLSTGGGFATRKLHSDSEEMIFAAQRAVVLNGIGDLAARPDLADRALSLMLPPVPEERRRPEREFWAAFEAVRPVILGALLDAVSAGLRRLPDIKIEKPPRMADFAEWGEACSAGFGWEPGEFLSAYRENMREVVAGAADASPLVPVIETLLGLFGGYGPEGFDGTAHELLAKLRQQCPDAVQRAPWFPKTNAQMGARLRRDAPLLKSRGIEVAHYKEGRRKDRKIVLRCISQRVFDELRARCRGEQPEPGPADG
jgi:putative DNA primase/helicase